jgi:hypothetical protein
VDNLAFQESQYRQHYKNTFALQVYGQHSENATMNLVNDISKDRIKLPTTIFGAEALIEPFTLSICRKNIKTCQILQVTTRIR